MILLAWSLSSDRWKVNWRMVGMALALQLLIGVVLLKTPGSKEVFIWIGDLIENSLSFVDQGSAFLFGMQSEEGNWTTKLITSFAFGVLPTIIFFSALMSILYYLGVMQVVVQWMAW